MSIPAEALTRDAFLGGRLELLQPRQGYRAAIDPVLLAAFVPAEAGQSVLELGCGTGAAALCLAARISGLDLHGLELQPAYADLARRNAALNRLPLAVYEGDVAALPRALRGRAFDHVMINPPFHPGEATAARDPGRARAHSEAETPLAVWIDTALRRLRPRGWLTLIHRTGRLGAVLAALEGRTGGTEILPLAARAAAPAGRFLLRTRKTTRAPLVLYPPFTLHQGCPDVVNGAAYTEDARKVLWEMQPLLPYTR